MHPRTYSTFWIGYAAGWLRLSAIWRDREDLALEAETSLVHPAETLDMSAWLHLSETERAEIVEQYAYRQPRLVLIADDYERQNAA